MSKKRGKLSLQEEDFISVNASKMSIDDIADKLNRTREPVERYINENKLPSIDSVENLDEEYEMILASLKKKVFWRELHNQFDPDEISYWVGVWIEHMRQFGTDVLASEEYQLKQLCTLDVLVNRLMRKRLLAKKDIERLGKALEGEYSALPANRDNNKIASMEAELSMAKVADSNLTNEQNKMSQDIKNLIRDLKGTRDQRFSKIESGEKTFMTLIKSLYEEEVRQKEGEAALLMQSATDKQTAVLGDYYQYEDGLVDIPLLTPESVLKKKEEESHDRKQKEQLRKDKQEEEGKP